MVVGGTYWQIPIIKKIASMGYRSLVVNLLPDSPAFEFGDHHEIGDITNKEECLSIAKEYQIDAIITDQTDIAMPTVAFIGEQLQLPALGQDRAALYTNKARMREFCRHHQLPHPEFSICHSLDEAVKSINSYQGAVIMKPLDANSSRGVFKIFDEIDVREHFEESLGYSRSEKAVLMEEFIDGTEFTVDGIMIGSEHHTLAISEKRHYEHNSNIASELLFSHSHDHFDYELLRQTNDNFIELSGLEDGCLTHAEYKYHQGSFYLIEIGARGGGNLVSSHIAPLMSGVDSYEYLVNSALGLNAAPTLDQARRDDQCSVLSFFDVVDEGGVVMDVIGKDYLEQSPNIISHKLNFEIGDRVCHPGDDAARIGYYIAYAETKTELHQIMSEIDNSFDIVYSEN